MSMDADVHSATSSADHERSSPWWFAGNGGWYFIQITLFVDDNGSQRSKLRSALNSDHLRPLFAYDSYAAPIRLIFSIIAHTRPSEGVLGQEPNWVVCLPSIEQ